jgi:hypothetical protein
MLRSSRDCGNAVRAHVLHGLLAEMEGGGQDVLSRMQISDRGLSRRNNAHQVRCHEENGVSAAGGTIFERCSYEPELADTGGGTAGGDTTHTIRSMQQPDSKCQERTLPGHLQDDLAHSELSSRRSQRGATTSCQARPRRLVWAAGDRHLTTLASIQPTRDIGSLEHQARAGMGRCCMTIHVTNDRR